MQTILILSALGRLAVSVTPTWVPLPGPQLAAYESAADITFYGGAAGGGKTDLIIGLSITQHTRSIIFRKNGTELTGIIDRMIKVMGHDTGLNRSEGGQGAWKIPHSDKKVEFGACAGPADHVKYQGRDHDLKVFDEVVNFPEFQVRFLCTWKRTTKKGQRCRVVFTGNPPTDSEGEWVIGFFAPWLDPLHPNPAKDGALPQTVDSDDVATCAFGSRGDAAGRELDYPCAEFDEEVNSPGEGSG